MRDRFSIEGWWIRGRIWLFIAARRSFFLPVTATPKPMTKLRRLLLILISNIAVLAGVPAASRAYSVLTHEQVVDLLWADQIRPLLTRRFPHATGEDLRKAHAFAYGGSLVQTW